MVKDVVMGLTAVAISLLACLHSSEGIMCFKCTSINGSKPECEDQFNATENLLEKECYAPSPFRIGVFPATHCYKFKGTLDEDGTTYVVRDCVVDAGGVNSETEIARSNHCGFIKDLTFNDKHMKGCILSCDTDGCNTAAASTWSLTTLGSATLAAILWHDVFK